MSTNIGTLVVAPIRPRDTNSKFPVVEDIYFKGSYRIVGTLADRDAITADRRVAGMLVRVNDDGQGGNDYRLLGDLQTWVAIPDDLALDMQAHLGALDPHPQYQLEAEPEVYVSAVGEDTAAEAPESAQWIVKRLTANTHTLEFRVPTE